MNYVRNTEFFQYVLSFTKNSQLKKEENDSFV